MAGLAQAHGAGPNQAARSQAVTSATPAAGTAQQAGSRLPYPDTRDAVRFRFARGYHFHHAQVFAEPELDER